MINKLHDFLICHLDSCELISSMMKVMSNGKNIFCVVCLCTNHYTVKKVWCREKNRSIKVLCAELRSKEFLRSSYMGGAACTLSLSLHSLTHSLFPFHIGGDVEWDFFQSNCVSCSKWTQNVITEEMNPKKNSSLRLNIPCPVRFISRFDLIYSNNQSSSGVIIDSWMKSWWIELILVFSFLSVHDTIMGINMIGIPIMISKSKWVTFCCLSLKLALWSSLLVSFLFLVFGTGFGIVRSSDWNLVRRVY